MFDKIVAKKSGKPRIHVGVKRCPTTATAGGLERWR